MSTLRVEALEQPDGTAFVFNNKNLLINGGMNVWQRSTSASVSTDTYATVDRFTNSVGNMGTFTVSRSTDVPSGQGFGYSTKWDCTTADASPAAGDYILFNQRLEGQNLQHLLKGTSSAKAVTLSFWVKSNKTGTYIARIYDDDNTRNISKSYTIDTASTWEKKEIVFEGDQTGTLDNDNASSLRIQWWLGAGSTYSSGTLATSWESVTNANVAVGQVNLADSTSNEFYITGCQLEVGSTASGFEFEPYASTLQKCQRYYEHIPIGRRDVPGGIVVNGNGAFRCPPMAFKVTKRTLPTMSQLIPWTWSYYNGSTVNTTSTGFTGNTCGFAVGGTASGRTTYQALIGGGSHMFNDSTSYIVVADAEL